jgi:hypothetical protein
MATNLATKKSEKIRKKFFCVFCDYTTCDNKDFNKHNTTRKHLCNESATKKSEKIRNGLFCDVCDFIGSDHNDFITHSSSRLHLLKLSAADLSDDIQKNYTCINCNKSYINRTGLWRHKKKCSLKSDSNDGISYSIQENSPQNTLATMELFMEIIKQNKEVHTILVDQTNKFMEKITELVAVPQNTIANCNNTNSNNSFNLNVFLNEHCKDAINMSEFIKSLAITSADLERTGKVGFVKGMSEIFINGLKQLDVNKRPIHCTDVKRESIYMKDEDKWEKDDKGRFHHAIQRLTIKNIKQLRNWEMENPEFSNVESETYDTYFQITKNIMGGIGEDDKKFKDKIVTNVIHTVKIP